MVNIPARIQLVLTFDDDDYIFPPRNVDNFKYYVGIRIYTWILLNVFFGPDRFTTGNNEYQKARTMANG